MAKIGLKNFKYGVLTENGDTATYGAAKSPGKAISCSVSITNNDVKLYADDALAESDTSFQSGTVTLGIDRDDLVTQAELLGHSYENSSKTITRNANDVAPYVGLGRIVTMMVENHLIYKVEFLSKVKFGEPSQTDNTRGETTEFNTVEIEGQVAKLNSGVWSKGATFDTYEAAATYLDGLFTA